MSRFHGPQGKGAGRTAKAKRREQAYQRQTAIYNDGTGMLYEGSIALKRVVHPDNMLRKIDRDEQEMYGE